MRPTRSISTTARQAPSIAFSRAKSLPVQTPAKFEIVANLRTAHMLGLTIPARLVASAATS